MKCKLTTSENFFAVLKSKDAVLKEVCNALVYDFEDQCMAISLYIHRLLRDLHSMSCRVCNSTSVAISNAIIINCVSPFHPSW